MCHTTTRTDRLLLLLCLLYLRQIIMGAYKAMMMMIHRFHLVHLFPYTNYYYFTGRVMIATSL